MTFSANVVAGLFGESFGTALAHLLSDEQKVTETTSKKQECATNAKDDNYDEWDGGFRVFYNIICI
ncbi:hypothetical protein K474DRAFT_1654825 [Panus rudis PR-1116 ss-1]|nr:hypothetical protein K474DRAFT_1654825 [Panus rudis PR-1116 ss-1]